MLKAAFIHVVLLSVFISVWGSDNNTVASRSQIDVCFYGIGDAFEARKTFGNLTGIREFITAAHVKVEIHAQPLTKVHKYSFAGIRHVQELIIWDCGVIDVEAGAFVDSLSLRKLDLRGNYVERISSGIFNHLHVIDLNLSHNRIQTIHPDALSHMILLEKIDLSNNLISIYEREWFRNAPHLRELHFENNSVRSLPEKAFENLIDAETDVDIFFSFNAIGFLHPRAFNGLKNTTIRKLYLDHNVLEMWNGNWSTNITELNIAFNNVKCINGDLRRIIKNYTLRNFEHNPYDCSCLKEIRTVGNNNGDRSHWFADRYIECRMEKRRRKLPNWTEVRNMQIWSSF